MGNLYYFTWASFLASFLLLTSCFEDYNTATTAEAAANSSASSGNGNESGGDIDMHTRNSHSVPNHVIQEDLEDRR